MTCSSSLTPWHVCGFVLTSCYCIALKSEPHLERWLSGNYPLQMVGLTFGDLRWLGLMLSIKDALLSPVGLDKEVGVALSLTPLAD